MSEERLIKIGIEKVKIFNENFDMMYEKYKNKALEKGYTGELRFIKEHNKVIVYIVI